MKCLAALLSLFALLITTKQIVEVQDMNGKYPVTYKTHCISEEYDKALFKKSGILQFDSGLTIKDYISVEEISNCEGR